MRFSLQIFALVIFPFLLTAQSDTYKFDHEVKVKINYSTLEMQAGDLDYAFLFSRTQSVIGLIGEITQAGMAMETKAIIDADGGSAVMLLDQAGMKMAMRMSIDKTVSGQLGDRSESVKIRKTGNTRKILSYQCEEYEVTDEEAYGLIWVTSELELPNFYDAFAQVNRQPSQSSMTIPDGFMMLMTMWPEGQDSEEKMSIEVTKILMDSPSEISTAGYQIMDVPNR